MNYSHPIWAPADLEPGDAVRFRDTTLGREMIGMLESLGTYGTKDQLGRRRYGRDTSFPKVLDVAGRTWYAEPGSVVKIPDA